MEDSYNNAVRSPRLEIDLAKIYRNTKRLKDMFQAQGISMMGVTKGVLGSPPVATAMTAAGVGFLADSRIENIMNYPAASSGVSTKDAINFIVASDGVLDPRLRNKKVLYETIQ